MRGKVGRADEEQVCGQVQTASVQQQRVSLQAAIACPEFANTRSDRRQTGGEHRLSPYKQSEFNRTGGVAIQGGIVSAGRAGMGGNLRSTATASPGVPERGSDWPRGMRSASCLFEPMTASS